MQKGLSMNKSTLIKASIILIVCLVFAYISILLTNIHQANNLAGQLVFAKTSEKGAHLDKVIITTSQSTTTLQLQDGFWLIKEGNNYYSNMALTNALFIAMNKCRYFTSIDSEGRELSEYFLDSPSNNNQNSGILIQTFAQNELLDEVIIGGTTPDNIYSFMRTPNNKDVWLINNDFTIPQKTYSWFQQPLLNYTPNQIRTYATQINQQNIIYKRLNANDEFVNQSGNKEPLIILSEAFNYMTFNNVIPTKEFNKAQYPKQRNLQITLFNGLITDMEIYADNELTTFWTTIKISTNRLPTIGVKDYINNNEFLYDGWTFQLAPEIGNILYKTFDTK